MATELSWKSSELCCARGEEYLVYDPASRTWGLAVVVTVIPRVTYCPFCGARLPDWWGS